MKIPIKSRLLVTLISTIIALALYEVLGLLMGPIRISMGLVSDLILMSTLVVAGSFVVKKLREDLPFWMAIVANISAYAVVNRVVSSESLGLHTHNLFAGIAVIIMVYWMIQFATLSLIEMFASSTNKVKSNS